MKSLHIVGYGKFDYEVTGDQFMIWDRGAEGGMPDFQKLVIEALPNVPGTERCRSIVFTVSRRTISLEEQDNSV